MSGRRRAALAFALLGGASGLGTCALSVGSDEGARTLALASMGLEIFLGFAAVAGALLSRRPLVERLGLGPGTLPRGSLALLMLGTLALSYALDSLLDLTGWKARSALLEFEGLLAGARGRDLVWLLLAVGLAPALGEELLCRGLIQRGLEPRLGRLPAVVVAAACFGALHVDPVHALFASGLGLYLGAATALAHSTRAAILCHAANNLLAVTLAAHWPELGRGGETGAAAGLLFAGGCLWAAHRAATPVGLNIGAGSVDP